MTRFGSVAAFAAALEALPAADAAATEAARARQSVLTKPPGSLGRLEDIAVFMAGWQGRTRPRIARGRAVVFAGNHGVTVHGVSAFPSAVTAQMVANFAHGGAAINALAAAAGLELRVVPLDLDTPTADFTTGPAMTEAECLAALNAGAEVVDDGLDLLVLGEMGIGNSTAAAALCARSFGGSGADWAGPGTGVDPAGLARKAAVVDAALAHHAGAPREPFGTLARVGGREIAAIAGAVVAARGARVPVVLDGFICTSAIAPLAAAHPGIVAHCIAGHCSAEPGHRRLLDRLGLEPLLTLGMRLGEGSGAAVAAGVIRAALAAHDGMATFAEAGVSGRVSGPVLLHLLRHGEPVLAGTMLGRTDSPATDRGIADCVARVAGVEIAAVVSSDLVRAAACADAIAAPRGLTATRDPRWRELDFGAWDGLAAATLDAAALARFWDDPDAYPPPGGERWSSLVARVAAAVDALNGPALVVTHGGAIRAALGVLCGFGPHAGWAIDLPYAALLTLRVWPGPTPAAQIVRLAA